ncbi:MAG: NfeD family protein [Desulfomonilia bacterium]
MPMKETCMKGRVILRYTALQILGLFVFVTALLFVRAWLIAFPLWLFWFLIVLWVAKDMALYPFVWKSYDSGTCREPGMPVGMSGVARDRLDPSGYIEVRGELWKAEIREGTDAVEKGQEIRVTGRTGLTLSVEPVEWKNEKE